MCLFTLGKCTFVTIKLFQAAVDRYSKEFLGFIGHFGREIVVVRNGALDLL